MEKISYEANSFKKEWKPEEYEKKLIEWLAIDPENLELNKQLADLYFTVWNHKKALSLLKKIIEVDPEDHNVIRQIWEIYLMMWDYETSELLIEKAINLKPNNPKYYISMVEIMYNTELHSGILQKYAYFRQKIVKKLLKIQQKSISTI